MPAVAIPSRKLPTAFLNSLFTAQAKKLAARRMAPWQRTVGNYLGCSQNRIEIKQCYGAAAEKQVRCHLPRLGDTITRRPGHIWPSLVHDGYSLALSTETDEFTGCQRIMVLNRKGRAVAAQMGGDLYVSPVCRRRGLASEILLADAILFGRGHLHGSLYSPHSHKAALASRALALDLRTALLPLVREAVPGLSENPPPALSRRGSRQASPSCFS